MQYFPFIGHHLSHPVPPGKYPALLPTARRSFMLLGQSPALVGRVRGDGGRLGALAAGVLRCRHRRSRGYSRIGKSPSAESELY